MIDGLFPSPPRTPNYASACGSAPRESPAHLHRVRTGWMRAAPRFTSTMCPRLSAPSRSRSPHRAAHDGAVAEGSRPLKGYRILRLGLDPPGGELYERINVRAAGMFDRGLIEETERLIERYSRDCRALTSLGYAQAVAVIAGAMTREEAVVAAPAGPPQLRQAPAYLVSPRTRSALAERLRRR